MAYDKLSFVSITHFDSLHFFLYTGSLQKSDTLSNTAAAVEVIEWNKKCEVMVDTG